MDLRVLKYFVTIVEEKTMNQAALKLNISQPPLSMEIRKLEEELGTKLFYRNAKRLELTEAGRFLYKRALNLLDMADSIPSEIKNIVNYQTLRIGMMSSSYGLYSTGIMKKFKTLYPHTQFEIFEGNTYELMDKLNQNIIELAVIRTPFEPAKSIKAHFLKPEPMVAVGGAEFFTAPGKITVEELAGYPVIYYKRFERLLAEVFQEHGVLLKTEYKNHDTRTTLLLAEQGLGVGIVPQMASSLIRGHLHIREIDEPRLMTTPAIVHKSNIQLSPQAMNFVRLFTSQ